jgi:FKBP-type peptidyl-prolyl cis-trans isomerase/Tetratricopeptide repeat
MKKLFILAFLFLPLTNYAYSQDTITTESGLKYIVIEKGNGAAAEKNKSVEVHYTGYLLDGKIFDSSRDRGEPIEFVLGTSQVIKGWDEGIALMSVGDKYRLIIPPELAYGKKGAGNVIPPDATLIFDVELMSVGEPKQPISDLLLQTIVEKDVQTAIKQYNDLKATGPDQYNFKESQLNALGYQLLQIGKNKDAIEILKLNIEAFPNSANVYDSMGEAYMIDGNKELAIQNYEKSLELNPSNKNAVEMLEKLQK